MFILTWYLIAGWAVWVFRATCIVCNIVPAIITAIVLLALFWRDVGNWVTKRLL